MRRYRAFQCVGVVGAASIALLGCSGPADGGAASSPKGAGSVSSSSPMAGRNVPLLAAAEPFEALTEQAFDAPPAELAKLVAAAKAKAAPANAFLGESGRAELSQRSAELDAAVERNDRTAIAIASVESYRVLVSAQDAATAKAPIAVSLLDYAGFKYDAHLKAQRPEWSEMSKDVAYARATWAGLGPSVSSSGLRGSFETALQGMEAGVAQKNLPLAKHAGQMELALVDLLEESLARRQP